MGDSWSFKPHDRYKSAQKLIGLLVDIVSKGGNLLLNVGPQPDGLLPQEALARMHEIGAWLRINGEAIYGTRPISPYKEGNVAFTRKGKTVYAIYLTRDDRQAVPERIDLTSLRPDARSKVYLLGFKKSLNWQTDASGKTLVGIPSSARVKPPCQHAFVLKFEAADLENLSM